MQYVRHATAGRPLEGPAHAGGQAAALVQLESVTVVAVTTAVGAAARGRHDCAVDRLLYVLEGAVAVELDGRPVPAEAGTLLNIPAGMAVTVTGTAASADGATGPSRVASAAGAAGASFGSGAARHLELFVPSPPPGSPLWRDLPAAGAPPPGERAASVTRLDLAGFTAGARGGGFAVQTLADHTRGVDGVVVNAAQVAAGGAGPALHIHRFDQLFVVLQGELQVSVAGHQVVARRHDVVVLPAGVAHTQWNDGDATEVHLAVLVPPPAPGAALTQPVEFRLLG